MRTNAKDERHERSHSVEGRQELREGLAVLEPAEHPSEENPAMVNPVVFLLDVDNTLLDNDAVHDDLRNHLEREFGAASSDRYWRIFEQLRDEHCTDPGFGEGRTDE